MFSNDSRIYSGDLPNNLITKRGKKIRDFQEEIKSAFILSVLFSKRVKDDRDIISFDTRHIKMRALNIPFQSSPFPSQKLQRAAYRFQNDRSICKIAQATPEIHSKFNIACSR